MGLYEGIKDVASLMQKADNIDLYRQLLDLSAQALEMQAEIIRLQEENSELKRKIYQKNDVERHNGIYITLKDDSQKILYCASCYGKNEKLIQLFMYDSGRNLYRCPVCRAYVHKDC